MVLNTNQSINRSEYYLAVFLAVRHLTRGCSQCVWVEQCSIVALVTVLTIMQQYILIPDKIYC
jgi:hypothetical protein